MANVKTINGLARANLKTRNGLASANIKTILGVDAVVSGGSPFGGAVATTNLVEWWPLNEASGNAIGVHAGLDLTDNGTVGTTTGPDGGVARQFTASVPEFFSRTSEAALQVGDIDFTFIVWIKADTLTAPFSRILSKRADATTGFEYDLYVRNGSGNEVRIDFRDSGGTTFGVQTAAISASTWYMVTAWHDAAANVTGICLNDGTPVTSATGGLAPIAASSGFRVGELQQVSRPWNGGQNRLGFFKRVLSSGDRTAFYNSGNGLDY